VPSRRCVIAVGSAALVSALLIHGPVAGASPDNGDDRSGHGHPVVLRFDVQFSPFHITDLGETGVTAGDLIDFHDTLLQNGRAVGDEVGSCVVVDPSGLANCTGVVRLGESTITYAFVNAPPPEKTLAVTGGSGTYRTAHGDGVLTENGDAANTGTLVLTVITD